MQEAQYDFLHGQTDRSDFFSPAMQQLCGIMKDNQVALPSDIGEGYFRYISPCPNIEMYICDVMFYRDTVLREQVYKDSFSVIFSLSDALEWKSSGRNQKTLLEKGDCCVYGSGLFDAENIYAFLPASEMTMRSGMESQAMSMPLFLTASLSTVI